MRRLSLRDLNIRSRLLLVCLAVALPLLAMCGLIIWKEYQGLCQAARQAARFQDVMAIRSLSQWIGTQKFELQSLAILPEIQQPVPGLTEMILKTSVRTRGDWNALALVDTSGHSLASSVAVSPKASATLRTANFFKTAVRSRRPAVSGYFDCPLTGAKAVMVCAPVVTNGHVRAVLVASVDAHAILRLFSGLGESEGAVIAVVDKDKRLLARTLDNDRWLGKDFSMARTVQASTRGEKGLLDVVGIADNTARTYAFDRMPETRWLVITGIPTSTIYGSASDRLLIMLLSAVVAAGLSSLLAWRVTHYFNGPINELVKEAVAIGRGDLTKRVNTRQGGELGLLARAFNQMAINLELNDEHKVMVEKISESIRQSLDLDQILYTTVLELGQAMGASRCCLALLGNRSTGNCVGRELEFNYVWWDPERIGSPLKNRSVMITESSMLKQILEQKAILSLDVMDDASFTPLFEKDEGSPDDWHSIKSLVACPIIYQDQAVGMILVHQCDHRRVWLDLELELVEDVAGHVALAMEHANLFTRTKRLAEQEFLINNIVRSIRSSLDTDTILTTVTAELGRALGVDYCQIAQPRAESPLVVTHEFHGEGLPDLRSVNLYGLNFDPAQPAVSPDLNTVLGIDLTRLKEFVGPNMQPLEIPISVIYDVSVDSRAHGYKDFLRRVGTKSVMVAPLLHHDRLLGILMVHQCRALREWQSGEMRLLTAIADQLAVAISHSELFAQVKQQAITDGLTGLFNHIYFKNRLSEELNRAHRKSTPCSLLMLDLDKLKVINDTMGHPIGDAAIRQVATTLKNMLRSGDTAARYGGEEFAVILPDTPVGEALLIAERLRQNIHRSVVPGLGHISTSIGAAVFSSHASSVAELIDKADKALYVAKRGGRNRVCVWDEDGPLAVPQDPQDDSPLEDVIIVDEVSVALRPV
ncbi:MAG: diguanylate cyclase [Candidatus Obscuribacterales bacterium]|nr:diguanylate cyclase [Candidatus Obscuribacterales bacterium]